MSNIITKTKEIKRLTINRAKWRTGGRSKNKTGKGNTQLLNSQGYMCCLGFHCLQAGVPAKTLKGVGTPDSIHIQVDKLNIVLSNVWGIASLNTTLSVKAMSINDNDNFIPAEREKKLRELYKEEGLKVAFTGEYSVNKKTKKTKKNAKI